MVTLKIGPKPKTIRPDEMKDGQIAIIIKWNGRDNWNGRVVQRYKKSLISVGQDYRCSWPDAFDSIRWDDSFAVRLLEKGEELVVNQ